MSGQIWVGAIELFMVSWKGKLHWIDVLEGWAIALG